MLNLVKLEFIGEFDLESAFVDPVFTEKCLNSFFFLKPQEFFSNFEQQLSETLPSAAQKGSQL